MYLASKLKQQGASMIEILVSIIIIGIVVLGYMGTQLNAVITSNDAHLRVQALNIAGEMVERMSVNKDAAGAALAIYRNENAYGAAPAAEDCVHTGGLNGANQAADRCNPNEMARFDIFELTQKAQALLPGGQLRLYNCTDSTDCVVVSWFDQDPDECTIAQANADNAVLDCVLVESFTGGVL